MKAPDLRIHFSLPAFESKPLKVEHSPREVMYQWSDLGAFVENVDDGFTVNFYVSDGDAPLLWLKQTIDKADLKLSNDSPRRSRGGVLHTYCHELDNGAGSILLRYYGYVKGILVANVFLSVANLTEKLAGFKHKVTCLVGGEDLTKFYAYLGRAQQIITNHKNSSRVYRWKAKKQSFHGISLHDTSTNVTEHLDDIKKMKLSLESARDVHAILSARKLAEMPRKYDRVADSDDFSNEYRVLPIDLKNETVVVIRFYNFKFTPPRSVEIEIPRKDLDNRVILTRKLQEIDAIVTVYYEKNMYIKSILLRVQDYLESLDFEADIQMMTK